jgi:hypothetical protein
MLSRLIFTSVFFLQSVTLPYAFADGMPASARDLAMRVECLRHYYNSAPSWQDNQAQAMMAAHLAECRERDVDDLKCFNRGYCAKLQDLLTEAGLPCDPGVCAAPPNAGNNQTPVPLPPPNGGPHNGSGFNFGGMLSSLLSNPVVPIFAMLMLSKMFGGRQYHRGYYPAIGSHYPPRFVNMGNAPAIVFNPGQGNGAAMFGQAPAGTVAPPTAPTDGALGIGTLPGAGVPPVAPPTTAIR